MPTQPQSILPADSASTAHRRIAYDVCLDGAVFAHPPVHTPLSVTFSSRARLFSLRRTRDNSAPPQSPQIVASPRVDVVPKIEDLAFSNASQRKRYLQFDIISPCSDALLACPSSTHRPTHATLPVSHCPSQHLR